MFFHLLCQPVLSLDYKQHTFIKQILDTNQRSVASDIIDNKFFRIDTKFFLHGFKDFVICCVILDNKVFADNGIKEMNALYKYAVVLRNEYLYQGLTLDRNYK